MDFGRWPKETRAPKETEVAPTFALWVPDPKGEFECAKSMIQASNEGIYDTSDWTMAREFRNRDSIGKSWMFIAGGNLLDQFGSEMKVDAQYGPSTLKAHIRILGDKRITNGKNTSGLSQDNLVTDYKFKEQQRTRKKMTRLILLARDSVFSWRSDNASCLASRGFELGVTESTEIEIEMEQENEGGLGDDDSGLRILKCITATYSGPHPDIFKNGLETGNAIGSSTTSASVQIDVDRLINVLSTTRLKKLFLSTSVDLIAVKFPCLEELEIECESVDVNCLKFLEVNPQITTFIIHCFENSTWQRTK